MSRVPSATDVEVPLLTAARRAARDMPSPPTVGDAEAVLPRLLRTWLRWRVVGDGIVLAAPRDAAGSLQRITGALVDEWTRTAWPLPGSRPDAAAFDRIAAMFVAGRLADVAQAQARTPEGERLIAEHERRLAQERHLAQLQARAAAGAAAAAELAGLRAGAMPPEEADASSPRRGVFRRSS